MASRSQCELEDLAAELKKDGKAVVDVEGIAGKVEIEASLVTIEKKTRTEHVREYTPNVIEPSFGIGRILYCVLEHSFWSRPEDAARGVLSFKPLVAPTKVLVVPLSNNDAFGPITQDVISALRKVGISSKADDSSVSIGKRYSRNDELGTPFGITIDFQTVKDGSITLRERDSTKQVRGSQSDVLQAVKAMVDGATWEEGTKDLAAFEGQQTDE